VDLTGSGSCPVALLILAVLNHCILISEMSVYIINLLFFLTGMEQNFDIKN